MSGLFRATRARWRGILAISAGALLFAAVPAIPAAAATPICGSVLYASVNLTSDLTCAGNGFIVGAAGITINLNAHTVTGGSAGVGITVGDPTTGFFDGVTIRNGTVTGFAIAVALTTAHDITLRDLALTGAPIGLKMQSTGNVTFTTGQLTGTIDSGSTSNFTIKKSTLSAGRLSVHSSSGGVTLADNELTGYPVSFQETFTVQLTGNQLSASPVTIAVLSIPAVIKNNTFADADHAVSLYDSANNDQIIGNTFSNNRLGLDVEPGQLGMADGLAVNRNSFTGNGQVGLLLQSTAATGGTPTISVANNTFTGNGLTPGMGSVDRLGQHIGDGLHITVQGGTGIRVAGNDTLNNANYGIYALPGSVVDGNHNTSAGNPSGCLGVTCYVP